MDGNYEAAEGALAMCLEPLDKRETDNTPPPPVPDEIGEDWFETAFPPLDGKFEKRKVPGEDSMGTVNYDFIYYNLGIVYMKLHRPVEARMCFKGVADSSPPEKSHLYRQWAAELAEEATAKMTETK